MIKVPDLMRLKIELGGGFNTNPKYFLVFSVLSKKKTERHHKYSVSYVIISPRWVNETWPLGVEYLQPGKALRAGGNGGIFKEQST